MIRSKEKKEKNKKKKKRKKKKKKNKIKKTKTKKTLVGAITPWEVGPIPIAPQLHTDLVIDTGNNQWSTTWPTRGLGHRLCK